MQMKKLWPLLASPRRLIVYRPRLRVRNGRGAVHEIAEVWNKGGSAMSELLSATGVRLTR